MKIKICKINYGNGKQLRLCRRCRWMPEHAVACGRMRMMQKEEGRRKKEEGRVQKKEERGESAEGDHGHTQRFYYDK